MECPAVRKGLPVVGWPVGLPGRCDLFCALWGCSCLLQSFCMTPSEHTLPPQPRGPIHLVVPRRPGADLDLLRAKLDSNELHALSITQALTPEEWAQKA